MLRLITLPGMFATSGVLWGEGGGSHLLPKKSKLKRKLPQKRFQQFLMKNNLNPKKTKV